MEKRSTMRKSLSSRCSSSQRLRLRPSSWKESSFVTTIGLRVFAFSQAVTSKLISSMVPLKKMDNLFYTKWHQSMQRPTSTTWLFRFPFKFRTLLTSVCSWVTSLLPSLAFLLWDSLQIRTVELMVPAGSYLLLNHQLPMKGRSPQGLECSVTGLSTTEMIRRYHHPKRNRNSQLRQKKVRVFSRTLSLS